MIFCVVFFSFLLLPLHITAAATDIYSITHAQLEKNKNKNKTISPGNLYIIEQSSTSSLLSSDLYYVVSNGSPHLNHTSSTCVPGVNAAGQNILTMADCWAPARMHNVMYVSEFRHR